MFCMDRAAGYGCGQMKEEDALVVMKTMRWFLKTEFRWLLKIIPVIIPVHINKVLKKKVLNWNRYEDNMKIILIYWNYSLYLDYYLFSRYTNGPGHMSIIKLQLKIILLMCHNCHLYILQKIRLISKLINTDYYSPFNLAVSNDGKRLYVVAQDGNALIGC